VCMDESVLCSLPKCNCDQRNVQTCAEEKDESKSIINDVDKSWFSTSHLLFPHFLQMVKVSATLEK